MSSALRTWHIRTAAGAAIAIIAALVASPAAAADPPATRKAAREIRVMERALDDMLIDSPNFLVPGYDNSRGLYVPGVGAIFTFEASLLAGRNGWTNIVSSHGHKSWAFWDDDDDDDDDADSRRGSHSRSLARQERQYKRGIEEMQELLLDEADTLTQLKSGEWVQLVGYFDDSEYLWDKNIEHISMKAKIDGIRAYASQSSP